MSGPPVPCQPRAYHVPACACTRDPQVISAADGMPTWVCEVAVTKPTVEEAIEYVKSIEREVKFPIVPTPAAA